MHKQTQTVYTTHHLNLVIGQGVRKGKKAKKYLKKRKIVHIFGYEQIYKALIYNSPSKREFKKAGGRKDSACFLVMQII